MNSRQLDFFESAYVSPSFMVVDVQSEGLLCASYGSGIGDLTETDYDFGW